MPSNIQSGLNSLFSPETSPLGIRRHWLIKEGTSKAPFLCFFACAMSYQQPDDRNKP